MWLCRVLCISYVSFVHAYDHHGSRNYAGRDAIDVVRNWAFEIIGGLCAQVLKAPWESESTVRSQSCL